MFLLPNNKQIDYETIINAVLDLDKNKTYWLDAETGKCYQDDDLLKNNGKTNFELKKNNRYFLIPKINDFDRLQCMKEYTTEMVENEDRKFAEKLKITLNDKNPYDNFIKILEENEKDGWIYGWDSWEGDNAFEEMKEWFMTLPFEIREKMDDFGCDCPICQAMKEGKTSEIELRDAFRQANFKNVLDDIFGEKK